MSEVAARTRTYLEERISFLKAQLETTSVQESTLKFSLKLMVTELEQTQTVLNGGQAVYTNNKIGKELTHA